MSSPMKYGDIVEALRDVTARVTRQGQELTPQRIRQGERYVVYVACGDVLVLKEIRHVDMAQYIEPIYDVQTTDFVLSENQTRHRNP